ncbi:MAG: hypothetical protein ACK5CY_03160, partial [Bacteroidia bacterium]
MKKLLYFVTAISLLGMQACSRMEEDILDGTQQNAGPVLVQKVQKINITETSPFSKQKLDAFVVEAMRTKGDFRFENEDLFLTWSALQYGDKSLAIGYKPARLGDIRPVIHDINI